MAGMSGLRRPGTGGFSANNGLGGGFTSSTGMAAGGPMGGLQRSAPRPSGTPGMSGIAGQQAQAGAQGNQYNQNRMQPTLNSQGGMTYATGNLNPAGYDRSGRAYYGWGADGPNYNPQIDYVQFGPGEGPGTPRAAGPSGQSGPDPGPMGGLIDALTPLPEVDRIMPIKDSDAVRNAYARAKDTAGQQGRAPLDALIDVQGARGIVGSGIGVNDAGGVIAEGARQLGDFNREQAIQRVENEKWRQGMNYQGAINQRGQNLQQRGQELERRRFNASNSPRGHIQGAGVNPIPGWPRYKMAINPNLFRYDTGEWEDPTGQSGLGVSLMGRKQNDLRRASVMEQNAQNMMQPGQGFGPLRGLMHGTGLGGSPQWDGFFGALQGKENAVQGQGGKLNFEERSFGNWKQEPLYNPMWDADAGEQSAVGEAFKDSRGNTNYRRRSSFNPPMQGLRNSG